MQKIYAGILLALLLPLFPALPAAGSDKKYDANRMTYYAPQLLPSTDDAAGKIQFLQPHIYAMYGKIPVVSKRIAIDNNGINFVFATPGNIDDEHTVSIQFASAAEIESNLSYLPAYDYLKVTSTDGAPFVFTDSFERAHMLEDAILTLTVASGRANLFVSDFSVSDVPAKVAKSLKCDVAFEVTSVQKDGPAEKAGLKIGDIIAGINNGSARGIWSILGQGVLNSPSGYTVRLSVLRDKKPLEIAVSYKALWTAQQAAALQTANPSAPSAADAGAFPALEAPPAPKAKVTLGVRAHNITASEAQTTGLTGAQGIFIEQVAAGSLAEQAKLLPGDVILALDGNVALTIEEMKTILQLGAPSNITVWRHGQSLTLTLSQSL
jgi:membrane-associated protease RseP (regulator of RpoE activity)